MFKNKEEKQLKTIFENALNRLMTNSKVLSVQMNGMTKHEQDLRQNASDLKDEAKALMDDGKQDEAKAKLKEAKAAKEKLDNFLALKNDFEGINIPEPQAAAGSHIPQPKKEEKPEYKAVFFKAIRGQRLTSDEAETLEEFKAKLSSGTGEDGGYIVPEDITTTINELKQTVDSLEQYVTVESVSTNKGARTLERRADSTPFAPLSEYGTPNAMQEISSPKFDRLGYEIEDYAGFLPVPNHLLDDTDQALEEYLRRWIAKKSRATRNYLILEVLDGFEKVDLVDYKGIKTTLNVDLDPAFAQNAVIFTNQDGFNYLDQLYDGNGRPLLQDDPQDATQKRLFGRLVVVLSNKTIATESGKAPFIIGDLKEAIVLWDRKQMSLDMTKEGGEAWRSNTTEFRAIEREDVTKWDEEAVVYGQIDITVKPKEETPEV